MFLFEKWLNWLIITMAVFKKTLYCLLLQLHAEQFWKMNIVKFNTTKAREQLGNGVSLRGNGHLNTLKTLSYRHKSLRYLWLIACDWLCCARPLVLPRSRRMEMCSRLMTRFIISSVKYFWNGPFVCVCARVCSCACVRVRRSHFWFLTAPLWMSVFSSSNQWHHVIFTISTKSREITRHTHGNNDSCVEIKWIWFVLVESQLCLPYDFKK